MSRKRLPDDADAGRRVDDPAIVELLDTVRETRTSLAIELSAAAGALEAGRPEVARDIVAATAEEMRRVGQTTQRPEQEPAAPPRRRLNRRALLALPAIPLAGAIAMTAAAAIGGISTPGQHLPATSSQRPAVQVAARSTTTTTVTVGHQAAATTLHRLEHVVTHHPQAAQVLAVADDLHDQLTEMIATAINDPARLHVVRHLLMLEQHVLESVKVPGTELALAASREIARLLDRTPPTHTSATAQPATSPRPTTTQPSPTTHPTPIQQPSRGQVPTSPSAPTHHAPNVMSKNTLFGRGLFNKR